VNSFDTNYQAGKTAFERGEYRQAVNYLNTALEEVNTRTSLGGEVQIWLVTALEASGNRSDAIALCQKLSQHPHLDTRQTSKRMLYIMQAPELTRKAEWMSEIPDLSKLEDGQPNLTPPRNPNPTRSKQPRSPAEEYEAIDWSQVNTKDNGFTWIALIAIGVALGFLWWMAQ
jgi:tetratricopeptide (TPR) repeat protein